MDFGLGTGQFAGLACSLRAEYAAPEFNNLGSFKVIKKLLAFFAAISVVAAFAAVDINKATEAELDGIKGIGPTTTKMILAERKKSEFKSWDDLISRVKGVGEKSAAKFSASGLTVGGAPYTPSSTATVKTDAKAEKKADIKAASAKPAENAAKK